MIIIISLIFSSCQKKTIKEVKGTNKHFVSKKYFIKGMTCGGCILSVKLALNKAENLKIVNKNITVGIVTLQFMKREYHEKITNCIVSKTIEKMTDFTVYLNKGHTKKACKT